MHRDVDRTFYVRVRKLRRRSDIDQARAGGHELSRLAAGRVASASNEQRQEHRDSGDCNADGTPHDASGVSLASTRCSFTRTSSAIGRRPGLSAAMVRKGSTARTIDRPGRSS